MVIPTLNEKDFEFRDKLMMSTIKRVTSCKGQECLFSYVRFTNEAKVHFDKNNITSQDQYNFLASRHQT
jgi:hypothetical protein